MLSPSPRPKECANPKCGQTFIPRSTMQTVCSGKCLLRVVNAEQRQKRAKLRERKEAIKTIPELIKEAQVAFNKFVRLRDANRPCICCGKPLGGSTGGSTGGDYDCGHYRSVGSASHLRFHEQNAHGQRKQCNRWGAGRAVDYRLGLIGRIGLEAVEALESDNTPHKWTREELREIRDKYRIKARELEKQLKEDA